MPLAIEIDSLRSQESQVLKEINEAQRDLQIMADDEY